MKGIKETVRLLKEQGRLVWVVLDLSLMIGVILASFIFEVGILAGFSFVFIVMVCWELSGVYLIKERNKLKQDLADTKDKLCLAEHEAANLRIELDIYKAAQKESAAMKPDPETSQTANAETIVAPKPKPYKRKPAPKRKPKTENLDENKN